MFVVTAFMRSHLKEPDESGHYELRIHLAHCAGRYQKLLIRRDLSRSGAEGGRTLYLCIANAALNPQNR